MSHPPSAPRSFFKWVLLTLISVFMALAFLLAFGMRGSLNRVIGLAESVLGMSGKLSQQQITQTFRESLLLLSPTQGDVLELATLEMEETVTSVDHRTLFDLISLGTTIAEIKVPVVYRYHLKLSEDWQLHLHDGQCRVIAPAIRPSLPPAVRTDKMEKKTAAGWARFNAQQHLAELERNLTPMAERRAMTAGKLQKVREGARQSVAEFVKAWLLKQELHGQGSITSIKVIFADEAEAKEVGTPAL
jgi:hypothetical protein